MISRDNSKQSGRWYDGGLGSPLAQRRKRSIEIVVILILLTGILSGLNVSGIFLPVRWICGLGSTSGLVFVLFVPGYALQGVLFPREEALDGPERLALSIGLSVALAPIFAWGLDRLTFTRIARWPILVAEGGFALLCLAIARIRGVQLQSRVDPSLGAGADLRGRPTHTGGHRAGGLIKQFSTWWTRQDRVDRWLLLLLAGALLVTSLSAAKLSGGGTWGSPTNETLTEFYLLGADGLGEDYLRTGHGTHTSTDVSPGQSITVTIGIHNLEASAANYRVFVVRRSETMAQATLITKTRTLQLAAGERMEFRLSFETPAALMPLVDHEASSRSLEVQFLLYREGIETPYRTLRLWLNVVE